ncbi:hypothetical protein WN944_026758 [Citrus x changshan-huyou]|uniref:Uncharacterized protein n=1 Tax=Citrus x changshan-huyou TaxID=2935761 RepID=A0AAP0Q981_9ROSI
MAATPNKQFKNICVLSGFNYGKHKEFVEAAIDLEAAFVRGSHVLGIIPRALKPLGNLSDSLTGEELVISGDLATLEALITLASWAHLHIHQKPIGLNKESLDLLQAYRLEPDPWTFVLERPNNDGNSSRRKKYKLDLTLRL